MKKETKFGIWVVFWATSYFVLLDMFASSSKWQKVDQIYTIIFILTLMVTSYVNDRFRRKLASNGKYKSWIISVYCIVVVGAFFNEMFFGYLVDYVLPGFYFISYYSNLELLTFYSAFIGLTSLLSFSIEWFEMQDEKRKVAILEKEKVSAEFKALVAQVNPHFLFNGLTVLYSLSLKDSKETSSAIIKLSDILRYVIYQSSESSVKLSSEAILIRDYIDLQRYRVHPTTKIDFVYEITDRNSISPMLFLPLVENAFKHGVHGETENAFVEIDLREDNDVVKFTISNNKSSVKSEGGFGLKNLKERLKLIYPEGHSFSITETEDLFKIDMQINLSAHG
jgi:LytS/YehU family sensor histidine kinase